MKKILILVVLFMVPIKSIAILESAFKRPIAPNQEKIAEQENLELEKLSALVKTRIEKKQDLNAPIEGYVSRLAPLHRCVILGDSCLELTKLLLDNGANPDVTDSDRNTPLHKITDCFPIETTKLLLQKNAKTNKCNWMGITPLRRVCSLVNDTLNPQKAQKRIEIAALLLRHNADPNVDLCLHGLIEENFTPFDKIANITFFIYQRKALIKLIIDHGADLYARDGKGKTALENAKELGCINSIELANFAHVAHLLKQYRTTDTKTSFLSCLPNELTNEIVNYMIHPSSQQIMSTNDLEEIKC